MSVEAGMDMLRNSLAARVLSLGSAVGSLGLAGFEAISDPAAAETVLAQPMPQEDSVMQLDKTQLSASNNPACEGAAAPQVKSGNKTHLKITGRGDQTVYVIYGKYGDADTYRHRYVEPGKVYHPYVPGGLRNVSYATFGTASGCHDPLSKGKVYLHNPRSN